MTAEERVCPWDLMYIDFELTLLLVAPAQIVDYLVSFVIRSRPSQDQRIL